MKVILIFFAVLMGAPAAHAKPKDWANGVYANIRLIEAEGDLLGSRVQIIYSSSGVHILFQSFEGEPLAPCLAKANIKNNLITAKFDASCEYPKSFMGRIKGRKMLMEEPRSSNGDAKGRTTLFLIN
jgi:hypothetical protein